LVWLSRLSPSVVDTIVIVKPETVLRWHRRGFRAYWLEVLAAWRQAQDRPRAARADSPNEPGESDVARTAHPWRTADARDRHKRIDRCTIHDQTWRSPRSQGWKTFLRNHAAEIASIDLFVVRTISFKLLYGLVVLTHARRRLVRIAVTSNPTAEWSTPNFEVHTPNAVASARGTMFDVAYHEGQAPPAIP
jgi:hypothetical protein